MRLIGRVLLTSDQGKALENGARVILPMPQLRRYVRPSPRLHDVIWVQEPYVEFMPRNRWVSQTLYAIVPGYFLNVKTPAHLKGQPTRTKLHDGKYLPRSLSRATLEVSAVLESPPAVACIVHMLQVDKFLESVIAGERACA